jgi:hypothetical protein
VTVADADAVAAVLEGAVDTHMHTGPGAFPRHDTDLSAARTAREAGMRAICTKNHHFETAARAQLASEQTGFEVVGGITLNEWVGGLNPHAVDGVATFGGQVVWMPSITARNHLENAAIQMFSAEESDKAGITVLDEDGDLTDDALAVANRIAAHDLTCGLSHLCPTEAIAFTEACLDRGADKFLVQHPHANFLDYSLEEMRTITDLGATLEFHWICTTEMMSHAATVDDYVAAYEAVGAENAVMATDGGATANPPAIEMFRSFVGAMLDAGVSEAAVREMTHETPRQVLGLED